MAATKRKRNLFAPSSAEPFPISRAKIECWTRCPKCFWLDRRLGVKPPGMPSMTLNRAVDRLMKAEFDGYRQRQQPHPAFLKKSINAIPLNHPSMAVWQSNFKGIRFLYQPANLLIGGAPDDVLVVNDEWAVLDFKATSAKDEIVALDTDYRQSYRRQAEIYSWLFAKNGHPIGKKSFLLFANGKTDRQCFDGRLDFDLQLVEIPVNTDWIEPTLTNIKKTLLLDSPPAPAPDCENCKYVEAVNNALRNE